MDTKGSVSDESISESSALINSSVSSNSCLTVETAVTESSDMVDDATSEVLPSNNPVDQPSPVILANTHPLVTEDSSAQDGTAEEPSGAEAADAEITSAAPEESHSVTIRLEVAEDSISRISSVPGEMCRICHCASEESEIMISPCDCRGSMKWVHQKCLQRWVKSRDAKKCELCGYSFNMTSSVKPFRKWKKLNMSSVERRKILCSVTFHVVAITCVIWSLYVLIDRTTEEIKSGELNWPFWTKLVVVAIGFTGGLVFMYVQCKTYVKLFRRWKQFNRVIYINDIQLAEDECATVSVNISHSRSDERSDNSISEDPPTLA